MHMSIRPNCFVVRPIHERSDYVLDLYVLPACRDDFELIPAGSETITSAITEEVFRHLDDDPLVLAYLGSPARMEGQGNNWFWNPNVMLEAGYRMGLKKPIVFMREHRRGDDEPLLPFDLADLPIIELPTEQDEKVKLHRDRTIEQIKVFAKAQVEKLQMTNTERPVYPWPAITMAFVAGVGEVRSASDDASELCGFAAGQSLIGMRLRALVDKISSRMMPGQRKAFEEEQAQLIGHIFTGKRPVATVCLVFAEQNIPPGGKIDAAYLPVVARLFARANVTELDVIYLDVTGLARVDEDGVARCTYGAGKR